AEDARRGAPVPTRPLHAHRARGARAPLADRAAARPGPALVRRDRGRGRRQHGDRHARRPVAPARRRRLPARARPREAEARVTASRFPLAGENGRLVVAAPSKGRMAQPALELCAAAGLRFELGERALHVPCANAPVDLLLVRPHDIPEYVQDGAVHAGITGANLVAETEADVVTLTGLGFARCTLEAAVPSGAPQRGLAVRAGPRVATAYPRSPRAVLGRAGVGAELVSVPGSVEATPRLGLADAVVDLVSTGSTASANG